MRLGLVKITLRQMAHEGFRAVFVDCYTHTLPFSYFAFGFAICSSPASITFIYLYTADSFSHSLYPTAALLGIACRLITGLMRRYHSFLRVLITHRR